MSFQSLFGGRLPSQHIAGGFRSLDPHYASDPFFLARGGGRGGVGLSFLERKRISCCVHTMIGIEKGAPIPTLRSCKAFGLTV